MENIPAFPVEPGQQARTGMTLRDYFAAKIMQGMCSMGAYWIKEDEGPIVAKRSYKIADDMLRERAKGVD